MKGDEEGGIGVRGSALDALLEAGTPTPEEIDEFLEGRTFPLVAGTGCTFVYRGKAREVRLRHWLSGLDLPTRFQRVSGTDLWYLTVDLPERSRVEYKLEVANRRGTALLEDPLNPRRARDPFGANSVCHAYGYVVPEWTQPDASVPEGSLEQRAFKSAALDGERRLTIYRPGVLADADGWGLLLVHDGGDYLEYADLVPVLDNLIHRGDIPPLVAGLMHPPDRMLQYRDNHAHAAYLAEELVPSLEREMGLGGGAGGRVLMGASLGAVATLSTAIRYPGFFGGLLLQSGSFAFGEPDSHQRGPDFQPVAEMMNRFREVPTAVSDRVFVSCGRYESLIHDNRALVPVLEATGMAVRFVEARDGHNWQGWRDRLRDGLTFVLPGSGVPRRASEGGPGG